MKTLFDLKTEDGKDEEEPLAINKEYAAKFHKFKECQELDRLKQKYGDNAIESDSSSESEDEEAEGLTPGIQHEFMKTLSMIKSKDPKIYSSDTVFFDAQDAGSESKKSEKKKNPILLKDYERQRLLEKGVNAYISDSEEENEQDAEPTYNQEQQQIKESFKKALEEEDCEENLLQPRMKTKSEKEAEDVEYNTWLEKEGKNSSEDVQTDKLSRYWNDESLDEGEKFLRDYILKKKYIDTEQERIPTYKEMVTNLEDDEHEEDDNEMEREEQFEQKFNFRFENPDQDFIKRYPRTIAESVRRKDDKRTEKRKEREERKDKEKQKKMEEIKRLKNLKRKEIMEKIEKLKEITGNSKIGFLEDDLGDDFDPSKYDEIMQSVFDNEYYDEGEEGTKPEFSNEEEFPANDEDNWDEWNAAGGEDEMAYAPHCEDPDFNMDADYVPNQTKSSKRQSKLAEALKKKKPVFDPNEKTFEEYFDEYYKLDYEDIINDLPTRFKYRTVMSNDFGLSVDEILTAEDKELNEWCSLKKTTRYNTEEEEWKERNRFKKKARNKNKKMQVLRSLHEDDYSKEEGDSASTTAPASNESDRLALSTAKQPVRRLNKNVPGAILKRRDRPQLLSKAARSQADQLRKQKLLKHFKGGSAHAPTLSADRLAAYGLDKRKKQKKAGA